MGSDQEDMGIGLASVGSMSSVSMMPPELFCWGRETKGKPTLLIIGNLPMQLEN